MIIVCPYVDLHPQTDERRSRLPDDFDVRFTRIDRKDPKAYERILRWYWEAGSSFCVVEQDVVPPSSFEEVLLGDCCDYGCFPYAWLTDVGPALGCTWFRTPFLERYPEVMGLVAAENVSWRQLDVVLMRHVLARDRGEQPHVHLPPADHLNPDKQLLPAASPEPLLSVPHW